MIIQIEQQWLLQHHFSYNVLKMWVQCFQQQILQWLSSKAAVCNQGQLQCSPAVPCRERPSEGQPPPGSTFKTFLSFYFAYLRSPRLFSSVVLGYPGFGAVIVASSGQGSALEHTLLTSWILCFQIHLDSSQCRAKHFQSPSAHAVLPYPNGWQVGRRL